MIRAIAWLLFASAALAQEARTAFEVASVKPSGKVQMMDILGTVIPLGMRGGPGTNDPGQISFTNASLKTLIANAYGVQRYQVSGPDWLDVAGFNIIAKVAAGATKEQVKPMLRDLLAERFQLKLHIEKRELPVYALVVAKNGPKMKVAQGDPEAGGTWGPQNGYARWVSPHTTLTNFADFLSPRLDRPVIDMTGLTAKYDIALSWDAENMDVRLRQSTERNTGAEAAEPAPNIFGAVQQQLGLKLEQRKSLMDMLMIDRAEKTPTENL